MTVTIHHGDCLEVLRQMPDNSVDAVVTDPPYGLSNTSPDKVADAIVRWATGDREYIPEGRGFMGSSWDAFVPPPAVWDEIYRVLKPGGHLVAFAGSRTHDLMGISIRLSGMDVRDSISWIAGSGFPKSHNIGKSTGDPKWDGWGTALKPSVEPISLARKPLVEKTVAANVQTWGTGGLNIDKTRIGTDTSRGDRYRGKAPGGCHDNGTATFTQRDEPWDVKPGRWPANVILDSETAAALDEQSGVLKSGNLSPGHKRGVGVSSWEGGGGTIQREYGGDSGGASRFFKVVEPDPPFMYAAKAPKKERPTVKRTVLRLRDDLTPEQVDHVQARLREAGISPL